MTKPYMPSNGTEGDMFDDVFCSRCERDRAYRDGGMVDAELGCPILAAALRGEQPGEWVWQGLDADGVLVIGSETGARCTAFTPIPPQHVNLARELSDEERAAQGTLL
jgi:hypothetical protein